MFKRRKTKKFTDLGSKYIKMMTNSQKPILSDYNTSSSNIDLNKINAYFEYIQNNADINCERILTE